jgi:hypothetical protein
MEDASSTRACIDVLVRCFLTGCTHTAWRCARLPAHSGSVTAATAATAAAVTAAGVLPLAMLRLLLLLLRLTYLSYDDTIKRDGSGSLP